MEFKNLQLEDVIVLEDKKRKPLSTMDRSKRKGIYPYYGAQEIIDSIDDYIFDGKYILLAEDGENLKSRKKDLVKIVEGKFWLNNHAHIFKAKENVDLEYLYYYLLKLDLGEYITGSTQPKLNQENMNKIKIKLPELKIQRKISKILSNIDGKIKLNNEINNNLYELCRKIFEQTFNYDMSFESLDSLCSEITRGYTKNYVEKSNLINLNQKVNKGQNLEKLYYKYLDENQDIPKNRYVRKNDILLNSLGQGTLGRVHLFEENVNNVVIDQHISILRTGARISPYYLYYLLSSNEYQNKIENSVTGTTGMLMLNISVVRSFKIPVPNKKDIDYFDSIAKVCMDKITINTLENEKLIELRDILLPKLMNGEIDLDNIEI